MLAYYGTKISPHMTDTPEGYLICHDVPIARTGDMVYRASELQLEGDPDRPVTVRRYAEDVFDPAAVASFEGKDVTAGHPAESVGPANHAAYSKGHVQNVRREGEKLVADLLVKDAALISDIKNNVIREVSCGYLCSYEPEGDHYRQGNIRGNHVAVVPRGRAGREVAIKDQAAQEAEKGRKHMSEFWKNFLTAFGMAAKDASPEELGTMVDTTAAVLDADPAEKAPEAEPAAIPTADEAVRSLNEKFDKLLSLLEARDKEAEPSGVEAMDKLIGELEDDEEPAGEAEVVPAGGEDEKKDTPLTGDARDAAMAILRKVRPTVAAIEDQTVRTRVADALIGAVRSPDTLGAITQAARQNAQRAADTAGRPSFDKLCADQKAAYDARNPHKKKEDN
ncbi:MAG: DUF2213 domain-containing protein [Oscillospiraceae bacterium]|nr:DUF2213 domain-containing protein [Oscillospiraceae bacterium]